MKYADAPSKREGGLKLRGITKEFPGVKALDQVDFEVEYGQAVALIGENGAGKSTLMKVLSGVYIADQGEMLLDGEPYAPSSPAAATKMGVVLVHQELSLLPNLTLAENIFLGRVPQRGLIIDYKAMNDESRLLLDEVGLEDLSPQTLAGECSVAVQQLVEIAKALSQEPRILVFDEPSASLGQDEVDVLFDIVDHLKGKQVGIVWITHRLSENEHVADTIVTLRDGARVQSWDRGDVSIDEMVTSMVGRSLENIYPEPAHPASETLLAVQGLSRTGEFEDISFTLKKGEILGIAGLVGSGRTELVETIAGARKATSGEVSLNGKKLKLSSPRDAVEKRVVLVPEDRKTQGLAQRLTIEDNLGLPTRAFLKGPVNNAKLHAQVAEVKTKVALRGHLSQLAQTLSGGNQQKGVIGKWLHLDPLVFLFDEPTRGIDVGARSAIYQMMNELAEAGAGVIAVSSELPEVMGISNRVLVLSSGRLAGEIDRENFSEEAIMSLAVKEQLSKARSHILNDANKQ